MQWGPLWYPWAMKPPIFMRSLTADERMQLEADRRIADAFRVRQAHLILARARRLSPKPRAPLVGGAVQTVRNVIQALNTKGVESLRKQSHRPKPVEPTLDAAHGERLQHLWPPSPRPSGNPTGVWTLALAAEVCYAQGGTKRLRSDETSRRALQRLETKGQRAQHGSTRPEPP